MDKKLRKQILERDGHTCQACSSIYKLVVHHIIPTTKDGSDDPHNLITLCKKCHPGRSQKRIVLPSGVKVQISLREYLASINNMYPFTITKVSLNGASLTVRLPPETGFTAGDYAKIRFIPFQKKIGVSEVD